MRLRLALQVVLIFRCHLRARLRQNLNYACTQTVMRSKLLEFAGSISSRRRAEELRLCYQGSRLKTRLCLQGRLCSEARNIKDAKTLRKRSLVICTSLACFFCFVRFFKNAGVHLRIPRYSGILSFSSAHRFFFYVSYSQPACISCKKQ